jgi:hypothetical protein
MTEQHDPVELIDLACRATGYMGHDADCTVNTRPWCSACSCGMRAVMTEIQALRDAIEPLSDPQQLEGGHG